MSDIPPPPDDLPAMMASISDVTGGVAGCAPCEDTSFLSWECPDCELARMVNKYRWDGCRRHSVARDGDGYVKADLGAPTIMERLAGYKTLRRRFPDAPIPQVWHILCQVAVTRVHNRRLNPPERVPPRRSIHCETPMTVFEFGGYAPDGGLIIRPASTRHAELPEDKEKKE